MININTKKTMPGHIIIKLLMSKDKEKIFKISRKQKTQLIQRNKYNHSLLLIGNNGGQKTTS